MKISTSKENLVKGIQTIQAGMSSKTGTMPILNNFLLETAENEITVVFTDLEMAVKHVIPVTVKEAGSITIPLKKFMEFIQNLGNTPELNVSSDDVTNKITVNSGKTRFSLSGSPKNEYPQIPDLNETNSFKLPALAVGEMINSVLFSASKEEDRHFLNGLLWKFEGGTLSMVGTDGRRLSINTLKTDAISKDFKVIVPLKVLQEVSRYIKSLSSDSKEELYVGLASNQIGFKIGKTQFISRLLEGTFPSYEQIIPTDSQIKVSVKAGELLAVTKRAAICSNDRAGSVRYTFKKGMLIINSQSQNMDFEDELPSDYAGEEDFQISFNPKFILDILNTVGEVNITAQFKAPNMPAMFTLEGKDMPVYIVMPLRV